MRMFVIVAGRIFCVLHVKRVIGIHFRVIGHNIPFSLLGYDVIYKSLAGFKVVAYFFHLVLSVVFFKNGISKFFSEGIYAKCGRNNTAIQIQRNVFAFDADIAIFYICIAV